MQSVNIREKGIGTETIHLHNETQNLKSEPEITVNRIFSSKYQIWIHFHRTELN